MAGRKGITIIIALLLATAITLAVALSAFVFIQKTQRGAEGVTETSTSTLLTRFATCSKMVSFTFNPVTNISEAVIKNCGFRDIDLGNDNLQMVIKTQDRSCVFKLNSTNCDNCVGTLGIGAFIALRINASAIYCASTLADLLHTAVGQNVEVVLSDKSSSFVVAATFVPSPIVTCDIELNRTPQSHVHNASYCYNYTITNLGNAEDSFIIWPDRYLFPGSPTVCIYYDYGCSGLPTCPLGLYENITLAPNEIENFSIYYDLEGGGSSCPGLSFVSNVTAQSDNCASFYMRDTINQTC